MQFKIRERLVFCIQLTYNELDGTCTCDVQTRVLTGFYISVQSQGDLCSQCVHAQLDRVHIIRYTKIDSELVPDYSETW